MSNFDFKLFINDKKNENGNLQRYGQNFDRYYSVN